MKSKAVEDEDKPSKWTNRERVMVVCSRGCSFRDRHLMLDLKSLMPHSKTDSKLDKKKELLMLNEICEMRNCSKCVYFENKKKKDLYMWISNTPRGPSAKFLVHNIHTMMELKLSGNCLKGSRSILSFDENFDKTPVFSLLKEMLTQIFGTPMYHPRSQPFIDRVFTFSLEDGKIWFRNYQIVEEGGSLEEIGPRMVLEPIRVFDGSFGGPVLYENTQYVSPNTVRRQAKLATSGKYAEKIYSKKSLEDRRKGLKETFPTDPTDDVFATPTVVKTEEEEARPKGAKRPAKMAGGQRKRRRT